MCSIPAQTHGPGCFSRSYDNEWSSIGVVPLRLGLLKDLSLRVIANDLDVNGVRVAPKIQSLRPKHRHLSFGEELLQPVETAPMDELYWWWIAGCGWRLKMLQEVRDRAARLIMSGSLSRSWQHLRFSCFALYQDASPVQQHLNEHHRTLDGSQVTIDSGEDEPP
jgi:hypothetical protein